jgi:hypothetical protein
MQEMRGGPGPQRRRITLGTVLGWLLLPFVLLLRGLDAVNSIVADALSRVTGHRRLLGTLAILGVLSLVGFFTAGWFLNGGWPLWLQTWYTWGHMVGVTLGSCLVGGFLRGYFGAERVYGRQRPRGFWVAVARDIWDLLLNTAPVTILSLWAVAHITGTIPGDYFSLIISGSYNYLYGIYRDSLNRSERLAWQDLNQEASIPALVFYYFMLTISWLVLAVVGCVVLDILGVVHFMPEPLAQAVRFISLAAQGGGKWARALVTSSFITLGARLASTSALLKDHQDLKHKRRVIAHWTLERLNWNWAFGLATIQISNLLSDLKTILFGINDIPYTDKVSHLFRLLDRSDTGRAATGPGRWVGNIVTELDNQNRVSGFWKMFIRVAIVISLIALFLLNIKY